MMALTNPYVLLAAAGTALALSTGGFYAGHNWATTKVEAKRAKEADQYVKQIHAAVKRGDEVAAKLAVAEARVITRTVEVIKHVPQVTTGITPCLSGAAVSLLNPGTAWSTAYPTPSKPDGQSPAALAASDRDVAYWIAEANQQYETAAARLNALIDFNEGATP